MVINYDGIIYYYYYCVSLETTSDFFVRVLDSKIKILRPKIRSMNGIIILS